MKKGLTITLLIIVAILIIVIVVVAIRNAKGGQTEPAPYTPSNNTNPSNNNDTTPPPPPAPTYASKNFAYNTWNSGEMVYADAFVNYTCVDCLFTTNYEATPGKALGNFRNYTSDNIIVVKQGYHYAIPLGSRVYVLR